MMLNSKIEIKIHGTNINHYKNIFGEHIKFGESMQITQNQLPLTSRIKVECKCDICDTIFTRARKDVKEITLCGKKCRNEFLKLQNMNLEVEKIKVNCEICSIELEVIPSKYKKQNNFLCSRECYKKHRSKNYSGEKLYNFQNIKVKCSEDGCNKEFKTTNFDLQNRNHLFCSNECYWKHRKNNYVEFYYNENLNYNRKETSPEKEVRLFLENKEITFEQEKYILGYFVDFYLPEFNTVIEVYGDYWHCNPKVFGEGLKKIHPNQIGVRDYDNNRNTKLKTTVKNVHIIWEKEIKENINHYMNNIIESIYKNP